MTLDELIERLIEIKSDENRTARGATNNGGATVVANCPVSNLDCWVHAEQVALDPTGKVVVITGGFGA